MPPPGMEVVDRFKDRIYAHWRVIRERAIQAGQPSEDLVALIFHDGDEHKLVIGPREEMLDAMTEDGVDFTNIPQLKRPAHEGTPIPSAAIWVLVALEEQTSVAVTRFVEPLVVTQGEA